MRAPGESYQVHFEVLAAPIAWEKGGEKAGGAKKLVNASKKAYLDAFHDKVGDGLLDAGFSSSNTHARGAYLWARWPQQLWFRTFGPLLHIRANRDQRVVAVFVSAFNTKEANTAAIDILRARLAGSWSSRSQRDRPCTGDVVGAGHRSLVRTELPGVGYSAGDLEVAAEWALTVSTAWLNVLAENPINDLEQQVAERVPGAQLGESGNDDNADED